MTSIPSNDLLPELSKYADHLEVTGSPQPAELVRSGIGEIENLRALLLELIDIEGPQPGHVMWFKKVQNSLGIATPEESV